MEEKNPPPNTMVNEVNEPNLNEASDTANTGSDDGACSCICCIFVVLIGLLLLWVILEKKSQSLAFTLGISSIEGLSPSNSCQTCTTISPTFTFTLDVDNSHNHNDRRCFIGAEMRVFYQSVKIAYGPIEEFCVERSSEMEMTVHAWSLKLELPIFLRDQLYEESMNHTAVFHVDLWLYQDSDDYPEILSFHVGN